MRVLVVFESDYCDFFESKGKSKVEAGSWERERVV